MSLITAVVPQSMKYSYITPLLKKPTLDHYNLANYIPISQLLYMSKTLERVVSSQLIQYITSNNIVDCFQSAYLPHRSTETDLNLIISEILLSLDAKSPCYLVLLDLSCAFDSLNLQILSFRLREISINGQVLNWFNSFVYNRYLSVNINSSLSVHFVHSCGIPQGSVLGPIIFIIYILPIKSIFLKFPHIHYHLYADDLQIYTSFPPSSDPESIQLSIYNCITELTKWFANNSLSLNISKNDTIILNIIHPFLLSLPTSQSVTTLGITFDTHFNVTAQIVNIIRIANYYLYNIRKTRNKLTFNLTKCLIHALVFSRLRYCCSLFTTLPLHLLHRLETIQRRAVRILYKLKRRTMVYVSSMMHSLGWLKFRQVCKFRLFCITHRAIYSQP